MVFETMIKQGIIYPSAITLHLYGKDGEVEPIIYDDWGYIYYHVDEEVLERYT